MAKLVARGAPQHEFAQTGVTIAAHHQQIGFVGYCLLRKASSDIGMGSYVLNRCALDFVSGEGRADVTIRLLGRRIGITAGNGDHPDLLSQLQDGQGVEYGARCLPRAVPSHQHTACRRRSQPLIGHQEDGASAPRINASSMSR